MSEQAATADAPKETSRAQIVERARIRVLTKLRLEAAAFAAVAFPMRLTREFFVQLAGEAYEEVMIRIQSERVDVGMELLDVAPSFAVATKNDPGPAPAASAAPEETPP